MGRTKNSPGRQPMAKPGPAQPQAPYAPSAAERAQAERVRKRIAQRAPLPKVTLRQRKDGVVETLFGPPGEGQAWMAVRLLDALGTGSIDFWQRCLHELTVLHGRGEAPEAVQESVNALLAAIAAVKPVDELEAQLAVQMAATHRLAMGLLSKTATMPDRLLIETYGTMAVKLLRTYTAQLESLRRYRSGGQQLVRVERVEVKDGGQAIVGTVHHQGGGGSGKTEEQPHEQQRSAADAPEPEMRGADARRDAVPLAGGEGEAPL